MVAVVGRDWVILRLLEEWSGRGSSSCAVTLLLERVRLPYLGAALGRQLGGLGFVHILPPSNPQQQWLEAVKYCCL